MSRFSGDAYFDGNLSSKTMQVPVNTITDAMVSAGAAIQATKLKHQHRQRYAQESATAAAAEARVLHVVVGATGMLQSFKAGAIVASVGAAVATVDLTKNGVSVLSAAITLNNSQTARELVAGTITSTAVVEGDVLEVVITATAGGGTLAKGVFVYVDLFEDPQ